MKSFVGQSVTQASGWRLQLVLKDLWLAGEKTVQGWRAEASNEHRQHGCQVKHDQFAMFGSWPLAEERKVVHKGPRDEDVSEAVESSPPGR